MFVTLNPWKTCVLVHYIRTRVEKARERQRKRYAGTNLQVNADMGLAEVRQYDEFVEASRSLNMPKEQGES